MRTITKVGAAAAALAVGIGVGTIVGTPAVSLAQESTTTTVPEEDSTVPEEDTTESDPGRTDPECEHGERSGTADETSLDA